MKSLIGELANISVLSTDDITTLIAKYNFIGDLVIQVKNC